MVTAEPDRDQVAALEVELTRRYRGRLRNLRLTVRGDVLTMDGVAESFHALQLVLRDILAVGAAPVVRNHITVRAADAN